MLNEQKRTKPREKRTKYNVTSIWYVQALYFIIIIVIGKGQISWTNNGLCKNSLHTSTSLGSSAPSTTTSGRKLFISKHCSHEDRWQIYKLWRALRWCEQLSLAKPGEELSSSEWRISEDGQEKRLLITDRDYWWTKQLLVSKPLPLTQRNHRHSFTGTEVQVKNAQEQVQDVQNTQRFQRDTGLTVTPKTTAEDGEHWQTWINKNKPMRVAVIQLSCLKFGRDFFRVVVLLSIDSNLNSISDWVWAKITSINRL